MFRKSLGVVGLVALGLLAGCLTTGPSVFLSGLIVPVPPGSPLVLTATGNPGSSSGLWTYTFASSCGGTFAPNPIGPTNATTVTTTWTTPVGAVPSCTVTVTLTTAAGRKATASASTVVANQIVTPGESLQGAINAANPGDVILVHEGTYTGDITINVDGLQLIAGSRPVIDGDLIVNANNVLVQGFEVTGVLETTPGSFQNLTLADTQIYGEVFDTTLSCNDVVNDGESIQIAIDAVGAGSTVCVGPGTYTEQISIGKDLTLQAIAGTPTIQTPPSGTRTTYTIPESTATWDPIVFARGTGAAVVNVSISGFEIDGQSNYGPTSTRYVGMLYRNVAGVIADNVVKDLGHDGTQTFGILVYGDSNVTISNNDVSNYGRGGIGANGDLDLSTYPYPLGPNLDPTVVIQGNTVTGPGATAPQIWASNGIQIGYGATGSILGNEVIGNGWPGTAWAGTAILVVDTSGVVIESNNVHDNESAITVGQYYATPVTGIAIRNNTVDNNDWGIQVINNASNTIVEDNTVTNQNGDGIDVWNYGWPWTLDPTGTEVHENNIVGSGYDGAWTNVTAEVVDMENNWWGHSSGLYDPAGDAGETTEVPPCTTSPASEINADGLGDSVGDTSAEVIDYCPWLSSAPAGVSLLAVPLAPRSRAIRSENPSVAQPIE